jgi:hypothetical protein
MIPARMANNNWPRAQARKSGKRVLLDLGANWQRQSRDINCFGLILRFSA